MKWELNKKKLTGGVHSGIGAKGCSFSVKLASPRGALKNNKNLKNVISQDSLQVNPWFLTGFTDAEGCFVVGIRRNTKCKIGWEVRAWFSIHLHKNDRALLLRIRASLGGVGNMTNIGKDSIQYRVSSIKELAVIIAHFDEYPLITQKRADFELFKLIVDIISRKEHLTTEGLRKIVNLRASINNGLSPELK